MLNSFKTQVALTLLCSMLATKGFAASPPAGTVRPVEVENALLKTIEATTVAAEVVGMVKEFPVVQGKRVKAGDHLGTISDSAVRLQIEHAKIAMAIARTKQQSDVELRLARKRSEVAENELERAVAANARIENTYPPKEVDRLQLVATTAQLEIERALHQQELHSLDVMVAENEYRQAQELLEQHQIKSPVDGVVVSVNRRVGEWVDPGTELLQIVKIDRLRIEGFVNSAAIEQELEGCEARVTVVKGHDDEHVIRGTVVFVSPDANPVNGQVRVFLEIENRDGSFRPGMRVKAVIGASELTDAPIAQVGR
ncbi:MAG: HlyD family efflux transporter periplasmic adaptor subunit [Planctomycetales bacterium]|nr:HlyD family efflux transporter periplasmic adaptor subunit [Planctomycetales bacterium]